MKTIAVYELQLIRIYGNRYPRRRAGIVTMGYFSTREKAENALQNYVNEEDTDGFFAHNPRCLGFIVSRYNVDDDTIFPDPVYQCTYTCDGRFNDETLTDVDGVFRGRPVEKLRFGKGDIVEVCEGDFATLGIVYGTPLPPERCALLATPDERGRFIELDRSDDQYTILFLSPDDYRCRKSESVSSDDDTYCPCHAYPEPIPVFPCQTNSCRPQIPVAETA